MRVVAGFVAAFLLALGVACSGSDSSASGSNRGASGGRILVAAAADLRFAFEEMKPLFERECGCTVDISFGSSGNFTTQIEQGLPADVFFSANVGFVEMLESKGLTAPGTKQLYAIGRIVLARNKSANVRVATIQDLLGANIRKVSIANPQHAPYGVAAQEAMTRAGVWNDVQARLVLGENASQATQFIESGDAQAGIVPLSLAIQLKERVNYVLIDESQHTRLSQGAAVIKRSQNPEVAKRFISFVNGPTGREIMTRYGFEPPH